MASNVSLSQAADLLRRGVKFQEKGKLDNALRAFDDALTADPRNVDALCHRGNVLADQGRVEEALASYQQAMMLAPRFAEPYDLCGIVLAQMGRLAEALTFFDRALAIVPDHLNALYNRALALKGLDRYEEAFKTLDRVIAAKPDLPAAYHDRGHILATLGRHAEALVSFDRALQLDSGAADVHCNRGTALLKLGRTDEAMAAYREALKLDPQHIGALVNLAGLPVRDDEFDEAEALYQRALVINSDNIDALVGIAAIKSSQRKFEEAARRYQQVLKLDLNNIDALLGLAEACEALGRFSEQLTCFDHLSTVALTNAGAQYRRGLALAAAGRNADAIECYDRALAIDPSQRGARSARLHSEMFIADWQGFAQKCQQLRESVREADDDVAPFNFLALIDDGKEQLKCARQFVASNLGSIEPQPFASRYPKRDRIRVGYFSADFHNHATLQLMMETLEAHDHQQLEITAFVFGKPVQDAWSGRVEKAFDRMVDVRFVSDQEAAAIARRMEIDIAVDLKGFTANSRAGIFMHRAAPVQISYLGYPGTSGMPTMDYIVADHIVIPEANRRFYSENILYLPGSYQPNMRLEPVEEKFDRSSLGLPENAIVYCCFNRIYKITPDIFAVWMRVLKQVDGSVLWLWADDEIARRNLKGSAAAHGVDSDRLIFANAVPNRDHLARLARADLFLDTLPYNAHTTASDALRTGLPILTSPGQSFAARVSASLLSAIDMHELITPDIDSFEALAVALGNDRAQLAGHKEKIARNIKASSLFDPVDAARKLEDGFRAIYERYHAGLAPAHTAV